MNKKIFHYGIMLIIFTGIILLSGCSNSNTEKIDGDKARQILNEDPNAVLIDVRTPEEHADNGIDGSILIPYNRIGSVIEELYPDKNINIILYCRTGNRSGQAAETLISLGYKNIYDLESYKNW